MKKIFGIGFFLALTINSCVPIFANEVSIDEMYNSEREESMNQINELVGEYDNLEAILIEEETKANESKKELEKLYEEAINSTGTEDTNLSETESNTDENYTAVAEETINKYEKFSFLYPFKALRRLIFGF